MTRCFQTKDTQPLLLVAIILADAEHPQRVDAIRDEQASCENDENELMVDSGVTTQDPVAVYTARRAARRTAHAVTERRHRRIGNLRLLGLGVAGALGLGVVGGAGYSAWWVPAPLAVVFWLGVRLDRVEAERTRLRRAIDFYDRGLARLDGSWTATGKRGDYSSDSDATHLYATDLDLFGHGSLFQRLSAARTRRGMATLAAWLLWPAPPDVLRARQAAVDELTPNADLREALAVLGDDTRAAIDTRALAGWGEAPPAFDSPALLTVGRIASVAGALAIAAGVAYALAAGRSLDLSDGVRAFLGWYFVAAVAALAMVHRRVLPTTEPVFKGVNAAARDVALLAGVLARLEAERFRAPRLAELRARLDVGGEPPSRQVTRLTRLMDQVDSRHNAFARLFRFFLVWDVHLAHAVERWRLASGPALGTWLDTAGEMEALASLAGYRFERPGDVWPELVDGAPRFEADALAHPLLGAEAVANDVHLADEPRVLVVSGSNMSGKSTLLRTIGISAVLAQAGAPVRARRLRMSPLEVGASIRITDSLQDGSSRFHAEITRLHAILARTSGEETETDGDAAPADRSPEGGGPGNTASPNTASPNTASPTRGVKPRGHAAGTRAPAPVLFLIDECLHGTNSHDRLIGARAVVEGLVNRGAIGLVTTHDLALAEITEALGRRAANVHFRDHLSDGKLCFDYTLRPGVLEKGNAIELMRSVGFEI